MAKYLYITGKKGSEWRHANDADKNALEYAYILESVNPDPDAENHLDGDIVKIHKESL